MAYEPQTWVDDDPLYPATAARMARIEWCPGTLHGLSVPSPLMAWTVPNYSKSKVRAAGKTYINPEATPEERELALVVINNWRSSHAFPLNTIQVNLRSVVRRIDTGDPLVAQRIKRLPSIRNKLIRFDGMSLDRMHDIGGCRAVLGSIETVEAVVEYYKTTSRMKHVLIREDPYTAVPQTSGYRGHHLVYRYVSDRKENYNGLRIEMQLRSGIQHAWATAVETVGTFTRQALKSSQGTKDWLRFFALMSSAHALVEGTSLVPGTPTNKRELAKEIRKLATKLNVVDRLTAYGQAIRIVEQTPAVKGLTFLLELDIAESVLAVRSFTNPALAADAYSAVERAIEGEAKKDVVLVAVESMDSLRRAYPNYFLDTTAFIGTVRDVIE